MPVEASKLLPESDSEVLWQFSNFHTEGNPDSKLEAVLMPVMLKRVLDQRTPWLPVSGSLSLSSSETEPEHVPALRCLQRSTALPAGFTQLGTRGRGKTAPFLVAGTQGRSYSPTGLRVAIKLYVTLKCIVTRNFPSQPRTKLSEMYFSAKTGFKCTLRWRNCPFHTSVPRGSLAPKRLCEQDSPHDIVLFQWLSACCRQSICD